MLQQRWQIVDKWSETIIKSKLEVWPYLSARHPPQMWPCTPKIIETAITFDMHGLESRNWYKEIQKVDVYISFKRIFLSVYLRKEVIHKKLIFEYFLCFTLTLRENETLLIHFK